MEDKNKKKLYPGDKGYEGGISSTRIYSRGKNVELTTKKDSNGNIEAVFVRDLWLGIF